MNNTRTGFSVAALAVAILLLFQMIPLASAQDQDYDQDPPTRAGRLGYVQGAVSFQPQGQGVWRGDAEVTGGGSSYRLQEGQQGVFSGVEQLSYDVSGIGQRDAFDEWSRSRDDRQDRVRSSRYVSDEMTGYEDLDDYGRWHNVSGYGDVWTPVGVPNGWAPYRYGHWAYVWPWGWTWWEYD